MPAILSRRYLLLRTLLHALSDAALESHQWSAAGRQRLVWAIWGGVPVGHTYAGLGVG